MDGLWGSIILAGFRDGLSPCMFMTCAVFIYHELWLKKGSVPTGWLSTVFALMYGAGVVAFNFGQGQVLVLQKDFMITAKILYFVLGLCAVISGAFFFKDWFQLTRGVAVDEAGLKKFKPSPLLVASQIVSTAFLGLALSGLATLWPVDKYVILLGNTAMMRGKWPMVMPMAFAYAALSMWPLWVLWAFLDIKTLKPSLRKIVCSAVFFTASSSVLLIFK